MSEPGDTQRLAEVAALLAGLLASPGAVHTSKSQTVADTQQVGLLDDKLCVLIRDLNAAAHAAIRNGDLRASSSEYTFHHLESEPLPIRSGLPSSLSPCETSGSGTLSRHACGVSASPWLTPGRGELPAARFAGLSRHACGAECRPLLPRLRRVGTTIPRRRAS